MLMTISAQGEEAEARYADSTRLGSEETTPETFVFNFYNSTMNHNFAVGDTIWTLDTHGAYVASAPSRTGDIPTGDLAAHALESPFHFEPLRKALTPDDHLSIVLDDSLPNVAEILVAVLTQIRAAGVDMAAVTVIVADPKSSQTFVVQLPDDFEDITVETHDAKDEKRLAYVATTKAGRRVYLNRTLVESDFMVVISGTRPRTKTGLDLIFPALSNEETLSSTIVEGESEEVAWLLGTPFFVNVIEGMGDTVARVVAGLTESLSEAKQQHQECWMQTLPRKVDLAVCPLAGNRIQFADWAHAARTAAKAVVPGGRVVVLAAGGGTEGTLSSLSEYDTASAATKKLPVGLAREWAAVAAKYKLTLACNLDDDVVEGIFATPIHSATELQKLLNAAGSVAIFPDAHKCRVVIQDSEARA
jgi:nickel-dependent lactate racemase